MLLRLNPLRSSAILFGTLALVGCAGQAPLSGFNNGEPSMLGGGTMPPLPGGPPAQGAGPVTGKTGGNVALLVPLTGSLAPIGQAIVNAAKLALPDGGSPSLDVRDTAGTPQGAVAAAQAAIAAGDGIILGPLTSAEVQAVAPIAQTADVNVLAFTNDGTVAAPGVWTLGITPTQQVQRVLQAAADGGRTQIAALLPDSDFGHVLGTALTAETTQLSEPTPALTFYEPGDYGSLSDAVAQMSDFADRGQGLEDEIKAQQDLGTAAGREKARELQHQQVPPPSFNGLFIGATDGNTLAELSDLLQFDFVFPPAVQILGPAPWASIAPQMANEEELRGALYAAPDPAAAASFDAKYQSAYNTAPPDIANLGFDAAAIAKLAAAAGGFTSTVLTAPAGFTGTDGVLVLQPSGQVLRGLAVFQIAPGAPVITSPAPATIPPSS